MFTKGVPSSKIGSIVVRKLKDFKQVDILISKNQAQQILYLKHHLYETS